MSETENNIDMFDEDPKETIEKASERVLSVWPPKKRDKTIVGHELSEQFIETIIDDEEKFYIYEDEDINFVTTDPEQYSEESVKIKLVNCFEKLPMDFFDIFKSGKRDISFFIMPGEDTDGGSDALPRGGASDRDYSISLKSDAIESKDLDTVNGILIHLLCHVVLDHPAPFIWPDDKKERVKFINMIENEAIELACEIGFVNEISKYVHNTIEYWLSIGLKQKEINKTASIINKYLPEEKKIIFNKF